MKNYREKTHKNTELNIKYVLTIIGYLLNHTDNMHKVKIKDVISYGNEHDFINMDRDKVSEVLYYLYKNQSILNDFGFTLTQMGNNEDNKTYRYWISKRSLNKEQTDTLNVALKFCRNPLVNPKEILDNIRYTFSSLNEFKNSLELPKISPKINEKLSILNKCKKEKRYINIKTKIKKFYNVRVLDINNYDGEIIIKVKQFDNIDNDDRTIYDIELKDIKEISLSKFLDTYKVPEYQKSLYNDHLEFISNKKDLNEFTFKYHDSYVAKSFKDYFNISLNENINKRDNKYSDYFAKVNVNYKDFVKWVSRPDVLDKVYDIHPKEVYEELKDIYYANYLSLLEDDDNDYLENKYIYNEIIE